jgi:thymidylate synthase ThyX
MENFMPQDKLIKSECILKTAPNTGLENYTLITCKIEVPYFVWTEILTHKRFARNASSNRAMSVEKNINDLGFYVPEMFLTQGEGMAAGLPVDTETRKESEKIWKSVWKYCSKKSLQLSNLGIAKEQSSRVLPSFKMMRGLVTGTADAWKNFDVLRSSPMADFAMQEFAYAVMDEIKNTETQYGVLHLPFITKDELSEDVFNADEIVLAGAGRIARISYGDVATKKNDIELGQRLKNDGHLSAFEHSAGWVQYPHANALCSKPEDMHENWGWENARASFERKK